MTIRGAWSDIRHSAHLVDGNRVGTVALARCRAILQWKGEGDVMAGTRRLSRIGGFALGIAVCGTPALAQTSLGAGLPSGLGASGLPFGPTSTVPTVASPTPVMAIANPGGLSFGGGSSVAGTGLGALAGAATTNAGGLSFGGGGLSGGQAGLGTASGGLGTASGGLGTASGGLGTASGGLGTTGQQSLDDVTGRMGSGGGGGAPAGAGIGGGAGLRTPTDAYFDPLSGSAFR